jgi:hypothetical protein
MTAKRIGFTSREINSRFIDLWETLTPKALEAGNLYSEMDLGSIMFEQLRKDIGASNNYRCYQDIPLLYPNKDQAKAEYDLALLHYPNGIHGENKRNHNPAIVVEFKLWGEQRTIEYDISKLEALLKQEKGCFVHSMGILVIKTDKGFKKLQDFIDNCIKNRWETQLNILSSELIPLIIDYSQWKRYKGDPYEETWYPLNKDGSVKSKQRKLLMLRLSKSS